MVPTLGRYSSLAETVPVSATSYRKVDCKLERPSLLILESSLLASTYRCRLQKALDKLERKSKSADKRLMVQVQNLDDFKR
jgi:hypothetical protein